MALTMETDLQTEMDLQIWPKDWGLPSTDPKCLAVMAYCKFCDAPVVFKAMNNPWRSPSGEFPALITFDKYEKVHKTESKVTAILNYLKYQNWSTDKDLSLEEQSDVVAFSALIEQKLLPALLHLWWVDTKCYVDFTRPWFAGVLPFPLGLYLPVKKRNESISKLQATIGSTNMSESEREAKIMKDAKECLNLLSAKLGDRPFFFGNKPSSLDALVFGFIAPLEKAPLPNPSLRNHIKACYNLSLLSQRIIDRYFPLSPEELEIQHRKEEENRLKVVDTTEFPNKRRNMFIAGAVVVSAMVAYSIWVGLIQIEFVDVDKNVKERSKKESENKEDSD